MAYTTYITYTYNYNTAAGAELYYLKLKLWHSRRSRIQKQPVKVFLKISQIS